MLTSLLRTLLLELTGLTSLTTPRGRVSRKDLARYLEVCHLEDRADRTRVLLSRNSRLLKPLLDSHRFLAIQLGC